jgi:hypothetical protein
MASVVAALVAVCLAAPAGSSTPMRRVALDDAGISMLYPKRWFPLALDEGAFDAQLKELEKIDRRYPHLLEIESIVANDTVFRAWDFETAVRIGVGPHLIVRSIKGSSLRAVAARTQPLPDNTMLGESKVRIAGMPALRRDYRNTHMIAIEYDPTCVRTEAGTFRCSTPPSHEARLFLDRGDRVIAITVSCLDADPCTALLDTMFGSIKRI